MDKTILFYIPFQHRNTSLTQFVSNYRLERYTYLSIEKAIVLLLLSDASFSAYDQLPINEIRPYDSVRSNRVRFTRCRHSGT